MSQPGLHLITIRLAEAEYDVLVQQAQAESKTPSAIVRQLIAAHLVNGERKSSS